MKGYPATHSRGGRYRSACPTSARRGWPCASPTQAKTESSHTFPRLRGRGPNTSHKPNRRGPTSAPHTPEGDCPTPVRLAPSLEGSPPGPLTPKGGFPASVRPQSLLEGPPPDPHMPKGGVPTPVRAKPPLRDPTPDPPTSKGGGPTPVRVKSPLCPTILHKLSHYSR